MAAGFAVLVLAAQWASQAWGGWVFVRVAYSAGAWWQLGTSQWVHFGWQHATLNMLAMVLMLWAMQGLVAAGLQCAALAGGYSGVALVLALDPACAYYAGASGALHGFWAGSAVALLVGPPPAQQHVRALRWLGVAMLLAVLVKLWMQQRGVDGPDAWSPWAFLGGAAADTGFAVYHPAHFAGTAGGMGAAGLYALGRGVVARALAQQGGGAQH